LDYHGHAGLPDGDRSVCRVPTRPSKHLRMNRRRPDRCQALSLLIAICLIASQWLAAAHHLHHAPGLTAQSAATVSTARQAATASSAGLAAADLRPEGQRADGSGHLAGDATCLVLAHLLLTGPPEATFDIEPADRRDAQSVAQAGARGDGARLWSPALPRAPPPLA